MGVIRLQKVIDVFDRIGGWGAVMAIIGAIIATICDVSKQSIYALSAYRVSSISLLIFVIFNLASEILTHILKRRTCSIPEVQEFELLPKKAEETFEKQEELKYWKLNESEIEEE
jgi:hypothetical protein